MISRIQSDGESYSVIIPVYNAEKYICQCLDSVVDAAKHIEGVVHIICIDDGSTDRSYELLRQYSGQLSNARSANVVITVEKQLNAGPDAARNRGLELARTEWVSFVDSDDFVAETYFSAFEKCDRKADINWFSLKFLFSDGSSKVISYETDGVVSDSHEIQKHVTNLIHNIGGVSIFGFTVNKFFKLSIIKDNCIKFVEGLNLCEDEVFTFEVLQVSHTIRVDSFETYLYRWHTTGLTQAKRKKVRGLLEAYQYVANRANSYHMQRIIKLRMGEIAIVLLGYEPDFKNSMKYIRVFSEISQFAINGYSKLIAHFLFAPVVAAMVVLLLIRLGRYPSLRLNWASSIGD